jgi:hypothetical protein
LPRIEKDGGSWLRRPELYKRVVEPHKKKYENLPINSALRISLQSLCIIFSLIRLFLSSIQQQ